MLNEIENLTQKEYRDLDALSSSDIKQILENPYLFLNKQEQKKSETLTLGSVVHSLILEPENFARDFLIMPNVDARTKDGKAIKAELEQKAAENKQELVNFAIYEQAQKMVKSFNDSGLNNLIKGGVKERTFTKEVKIAEKNYKFKIRPDYFNKEKLMILDLKTTSAKNGASADEFIKNIANFKYYIQAALYSEILNANDFYFVVLETQEPFMCGIYKLDKISLEFGLKEIERALNIFDNIDKFKKPLYLDFENDFKKVQELTLPNYVYYKKGASI